MLRTAFLVAIIYNVVYNLIIQKQKLTEAGRTLPLSIAYASEKELSNDFNKDFSIDEQQAETDGAQDTAQLEKEDATACNKQDETAQYEPKRLLPQSRNATFDVARIIAMFLIVASHFLGHGGWMNNMSGTNLVFAKILQSVFYPAVDVFVLTSAYFSCTKTKLNVKKLATLYATVWFYSMLLFTVATASGMIPYNQGQLISSIFPVLTGKYWFFSAYIFLSLLVPFLNIVVKHVSKKQHLVLAICALILGSLSSDAHILPQFGIDSGYNLIWFVCLYFVGSYIRIYDVKIPRKFFAIPLLLYVACVVGGYFARVAHASILSSLGAVLIVLFCKHFPIRSKNLSKAITAVSSVMFGVYLIHDSNEMRAYIYQNVFHSYKYYSSKYSFLILLGFISVTFVVCALCECVRKQGENLVRFVVKKAKAKLAK